MKQKSSIFPVNCGVFFLLFFCSILRKSYGWIYYWLCVPISTANIYSNRFASIFEPLAIACSVSIFNASPYQFSFIASEK